jgi:antitoxin MazE
MVASIVQIGNSKGIRIPKFVLEELDIQDSVDLRISDDRLIVTPLKKNPREGWKDAFQNMHEHKDDHLLISGVDAGQNSGFGWDM